jgi:hypothetical protein
MLTTAIQFPITLVLRVRWTRPRSEISFTECLSKGVTELVTVLVELSHKDREEQPTNFEGLGQNDTRFGLNE